MKDCVGFKYVLSGRPINFVVRHRDEWERKMSNTKYLNSYEDSTFVHITCNYSRKKLRKILLSNVFLKQRQFKTMQGMVILFFFFLLHLIVSLACPLYYVLDCQAWTMDVKSCWSSNGCKSFRHNSIPFYFHTEKYKSLKRFTSKQPVKYREYI